MAGKQAKIFSEQQVEDLLFFAKTTRNPDRNRVIVLLSTKAGLRAAEIANLTWEMVVEPTRNVSSHIELRDHAAKMGSGRTVPVSALLHERFVAWRTKNRGHGPVVTSERGGKMTALMFSCGHRSIQTTQRYIDGDSDAQRRLVSVI
jgi:integrase